MNNFDICELGNPVTSTSDDSIYRNIDNIEFDIDISKRIDKNIAKFQKCRDTF